MTKKKTNRHKKPKQFFPRLDNAACAPVADLMISYCDSGDYFCDNGTSSNALAIHEGYVNEYKDQAAQYVIDKIGDCTAAAAAASR